MCDVTNVTDKCLKWWFLHFFYSVEYFSSPLKTLLLFVPKAKDLVPCPLEKPIISTHSLFRASRPRKAPGSTVLIKLFFRSLGKRDRKRRSQSRQLNQWLFILLSLLVVCTDIKWWLDITLEMQFTELMRADRIHPCLSRKRNSFEMHVRMFILLTE